MKVIKIINVNRKVNLFFFLLVLVYPIFMKLNDLFVE